MKKIFILLLVLSLLTSIICLPTVSQAADATPTLGEKLAAMIFAESSPGTPLYSVSDKTMFIKLIQLFHDVDDTDGIAEAYKNAFGQLSGGQQTRVNDFGGGITFAANFAKFMKKISAQTSIDQMSTYLLNNDKAGFAAAIDNRKDDFYSTMGITDATVSTLNKFITSLPKLFTFLNQSAIWHTEVFNHNTNTGFMTLILENGIKIVDSANLQLVDKITDKLPPVNAMIEMAIYYNKASTHDQALMLTYLTTYGFIRESTTDYLSAVITSLTPTPTPTTTPTPDSGSGSGSGTPSTPAPTPNLVSIPNEDLAAAGAAGTFNIKPEVSGGLSNAQYQKSDWDKAAVTQGKNPLILHTRSQGTSVSASRFTLDYSVLLAMKTANIPNMILDTDMGQYSFSPDSFDTAVNSFLKDAPKGTDAFTQLIFDSKKITVDQAFLDKLSAEQKTGIKVGMIVYQLTLTISHTDTDPATKDSPVTKILTSADLFNHTITATLPYEPAAGTDVNTLSLYFISGTTLINERAEYDSANKALVAQLAHFSQYIPLVTKTTFSDIAANHWALPYINSVYAKGIMDTDTKFLPNDFVTRGQFAQYLQNTLKLQLPVVRKNFNDAKAGSKYADAIEAIFKAGIINGYPTGNFGVNDKITREQMAMMITRALGTSSSDATASDLTYADKNKIGKIYQDAVAKVAAANIMAGISGNNFNPQGNVTRAETAAILSRLSKIMLGINQ